jgi:LEA14-like dessication related protein
MKRFLIWTGVIAIVAGTATYIAYQAKLAKQLLYNVHGLRVIQISKSLIKLSLNVSIQNNTELDVIITGMDMKVYVNNVYVTTAKSNYTVNIKPNQSSDLPVTLEINPSDVWDDVSQLLFGSSSLAGVSIRIKGKVRVKKFGLPLSIPVTHEMTLGEFMS